MPRSYCGFAAELPKPAIEHNASAAAAVSVFRTMSRLNVRTQWASDIGHKVRRVLRELSDVEDAVVSAEPNGTTDGVLNVQHQTATSLVIKAMPSASATTASPLLERGRSRLVGSRSVAPSGATARKPSRSALRPAANGTLPRPGIQPKPKRTTPTQSIPSLRQALRLGRRRRASTGHGTCCG